MKKYQAALIALNSSSTPAAMQNKFAKIAVEAQDPTLKELAGKVSFMFSCYIELRFFKRDVEPGIPANHQEWVIMRDRTTSELKTYCEMVLNHTKPEWQIAAEKHGWMFVSQEDREKLGLRH